MPTWISCPACGGSIWLSEGQVGRGLACPRCRHRWDGDDPEPQPLPQPAPDPRDFDDDSDGDRRVVVEAPRRDWLPHRSGLVLTLGVVSLCLAMIPPVGILLGLAAWVLGQNDLKRMRNNEMDPEGRSTTLGGLITGVVGIFLSLLFLLAYFGLWSAMSSPGAGVGPGVVPGPVVPPPPPKRW